MSPSAWRERVLAVVREREPLTCGAIYLALNRENAWSEYRYRAIDRALQSLRRAGLIVYDRRTGWRIK